jgi:hypothetical protein
MTIAFAVLLNLAAATVLLILLTATMRLPYRLPNSARADRVDAQRKARAQRRPQPQPSTRRRADAQDAPEPAY